MTLIKRPVEEKENSSLTVIRQKAFGEYDVYSKSCPQGTSACKQTGQALVQVQKLFFHYFLCVNKNIIKVNHCNIYTRLKSANVQSKFLVARA